MKASIIIPTRNRAETLKKCLNSLKEQTVKDFEVIIVDDGSEDNTKEVVSEVRGLKKKYVYQEHSQQGVARNNGIKLAKGKFVFFIGDDIIPENNWLEQHLKTHDENKNAAVLGLTLWPKEMEVNDFMNYIAPNGPQFNYGGIKNNKNCSWRFFWTSNISLEKKWLKENFDENFRGWGYEDLDLGYRLEKKGLVIVLNNEARAYHYHSYNDPEEFLRKQENAAKSALYFVGKFPELKEEIIEKNKLKNWQALSLTVYGMLPFLKSGKKLKIIYWKLKRRDYFNKGL